jgi:hypothetical protein
MDCTSLTSLQCMWRDCTAPRRNGYYHCREHEKIAGCHARKSEEEKEKKKSLPTSRNALNDLFTTQARMTRQARPNSLYPVQSTYDRNLRKYEVLQGPRSNNSYYEQRVNSSTSWKTPLSFTSPSLRRQDYKSWNGQSSG